MNHGAHITANKSNTSYSVHIIYILFLIILFGLCYYFYDLNKNYISENNNIQSQLSELRETLTNLNQKYTEAVNKIEISEQDKLFLISNLNNTMSDYSGLKENYNTKLKEVDTLSKAVYIDDELLKKYSKFYFLNENYAPSSTALINPVYTLNNKDLPILTEVKPKLESMLQTSLNSGTPIVVHSGYRSFKEQQGLKGVYTQKFGTKANQFSADQGYSEHQLGSTVDISDGVAGLNEKFDKTKTFEWLQANAYKYGFILSYNKNNSYYVYEPWHFRFVGVALATYMHDNGLNFYDLDQKVIDSYKTKIFD